MKKGILSILFILGLVGNAFAFTYEAGGDGVQEGSNVNFAFGTFSTILKHTSGTEASLSILSNHSTTGTAAATDLLLNRTIISVGSGEQLLIDARVDDVSKFKVDTNGFVTASIFYGPLYSTLATGTANNVSLGIQNRNFSAANSGVYMSSGTVTNSTGHYNAVRIIPIYTQTGDGSATDLLINREINSVGSGPQLLADFQTDDVSQFSVDTIGNMTIAGSVTFSGVSSIAANYTVVDKDPIVTLDCDATGGDVTITLPTLADNYGRLLEMRLASATNNCIFDGEGGETINGATTQTVSTQYNVITIKALASEWGIF